MASLDGVTVKGVTEAELRAVRALARGQANPDQQTRALGFIIDRVARTDEASFALDKDGGERATAFAEGRRSVGLALRTIIALKEPQVSGVAEQTTGRKRPRKPAERPNG